MSHKNVQIPMELFINVMRLCRLLEEYNLDAEDKKFVFEIKEQIDEKINKMINHDLYTKSKTGTEEEKEKARQEYLDRVGMHKDWRY